MASRSHVAPLLLLSFFCLFPNVAGYIQRHIIDDTDSSIHYSPDGWTRGNTCASCSEGLDLNQIYGKTWNNGSTLSSSTLKDTLSVNTLRGSQRGAPRGTGRGSKRSSLRDSSENPVFFGFSFIGISFDIVFIAQAIPPITNSTQGVLSDTNVTITVDGIERLCYFGQLVQGSDANQLVAYNKSLYAQSWTTNGKHDVRVDLAPSGSTFSLDYIAYSVEVEDEGQVSQKDWVSPTVATVATVATVGDEMPSSDTSVPSDTSVLSDASDRGKAIAIGVAIGAFALLALAGFLAWWYLHRRRTLAARKSTLQPFDQFVNPAPSKWALASSSSSTSSSPSPSPSQPIPLPLSTTGATRGRGSGGGGDSASPVRDAHSSHSLQSTRMPTTVLLSRPASELDGDDPPPAYSPGIPQSSSKPLTT